MDDRRPVGSRFQDTCRTTRECSGLPEGPGIPSGITHDLVLQFDLPARRMEREARLLAMRGGDVNATLVDACREGGVKDARFLLAHGANANHRDNDKWSVSSIAARNGHLAVVKALLEAGARELDEAFSHAAMGGHVSVMTLLLTHGADVHYKNDDALYWASYHGHLETATFLLKRGATAERRSLSAATRHGHDAIASLLRAHGATL